MKKIIQKFKTDTKGAVTVFFIVIVTVVFLFNAVLIDYARIFAAEQQSEYAIQSAVRSAAAEFDKKLKKEYGLFGVEEGDEATFKKVLKENLEHVSSDADRNLLQFVNPTVEEDEVNISYSRELAHPEILEHQILEDMKYKAPVEITKELLEKFSFVSEAMEATSTFIDTAEEIVDDFEERERKLDEFLKKIKQTQNHLDTVLTDLQSYSNSTFPKVNNFNDIIRHFSDYENLKEYLEELEDSLDDIKDKKEKKEIEDEIDEVEEDIEAFEDAANDKIKELRETADDAVDAIIAAEPHLEKAKELNDKVKEVIDNNQNDAAENYDNANNNADGPPGGVDSGGVNEAISSIEELNAELEQYVYDPSPERDGYDFFGDLEGYLNAAIPLVEVIPENFQEVEGNIELSDEDSLFLLRDYAREDLNEALVPVEAIIDYHASEKWKEFEIDEGDFISEDEKEAENHREDAGDTLELDGDLLSNIQADQGTYDELKGIMETYELFVEENDLLIDSKFDIGNFEPDDVEDLDLDDSASSSGKSAMNLVDALFGNLGDILVGARNELYKNEYILMNFESSKPTGITNANDYYFDQRQVEFILYGQYSAGMNYSAALTQLFALRFALRFIDAFTVDQVRLAGHPLLVFFAALEHALRNAIDDTKNLAKSTKVPLIGDRITPIGFIDVVYRDYLRLFLFMNPGGDKRLMRVMTVIEHDSGINLTERMTYIEGEVSTSSSLWFIPQVTSFLGRMGMLNGEVNAENEYQFHRQAHFSY